MKKHQVSDEKDTSDQLFAKIFMPLLLSLIICYCYADYRTAKY